MAAARRRVGIHHDPGHRVHDVPGHPECPARIDAILEALDGGGIRARLASLPPRIATDDELLLVHTPRLLSQLRAAEAAGGLQLDADTAVLPGSMEAAARAVGGALAGVDALMTGDLDAVFCVGRPPGHHATADIAMGFCLFNQAAVAARYAQRQHGVGQVAIIDFDVHHGNGTQAIFERDPSVLYCSTHEYPFYPGTGHWRDQGVGTLVNLPLPPGCADTEYAACFCGVLGPAVERFVPELIIVSAGFDAHIADPLADMALTDRGYAFIAGEIARLAQTSARGRMLWVLEGGYRVEAVARSVQSVLSVLLGDAPPPTIDAEPRADVVRLIDTVRQLHGL